MKNGKKKRNKNNLKERNNQKRDKKGDNKERNKKRREDKGRKKENKNFKLKRKPLSIEILIGRLLNFASS